MCVCDNFIIGHRCEPKFVTVRRHIYGASDIIFIGVELYHGQHTSNVARSFIFKCLYTHLRFGEHADCWFIFGHFLTTAFIL